MVHIVLKIIFGYRQTRQSFIRINELVYRECAVGKSQANLSISKEAS